MDNNSAIPQTRNSKMLRAMVGIGLVCGLLIVLTYEGTLPRVQRLKAEALKQAIFKVVPEVISAVPYTFSDGQFVKVDEGNDAELYATYDQKGVFRGVAIETAGQGYADIIRILYGYDPGRQQVVGFYVLESKETPGLGDKIEKEIQFLDNFQGLDATLKEDLKSLKNNIVTVKQGTKTQFWEIDGITGATISSRAIGDMMASSVTVWAPRVYRHQEIFKTQAP